MFMCTERLDAGGDGDVRRAEDGAEILGRRDGDPEVVALGQNEARITHGRALGAVPSGGVTNAKENQLKITRNGQE